MLVDNDCMNHEIGKTVSGLKMTSPGSARESFRAAMLIGIGIMAAVDEIIFHQLLAWHHLYDRSTTKVGLMADGILHAAELVVIVAGFFWMLELRKSGSLVKPFATAGLFVGLGLFQLFDGLIDHKVLRLHQIRYVDNVVPYDIAWNVTAVILLAIGFVLWRNARKVC